MWIGETGKRGPLASGADTAMTMGQEDLGWGFDRAVLWGKNVIYTWL
jgi:hypothetical protein